MSRFKRTATFVAVFVLVALAAGTPRAWAAELEPVTLPGTGDSQDLLRALAQSYTAQFPDRSVVVPNSTGSDGGIKVVGTGESPIGRVSRLPDSQEIAKYGQFEYLEFSRVPVVFVIGAQAGVRNLIQQQVCDLFIRLIPNCKDVGGRDGRVLRQPHPQI